MYAADYKPFDNERRLVLTWRSGEQVNQGYWRIKPKNNAEYFTIKNTVQNEYLFACGNNLFTENRRMVFTFRPATEVRDSNWEISC